MYSAIRQLKVAHSQHDIEQMVWSNQFDLVVVSNSKGEVALHRLLFVKAWDLPPPTEKDRVTGLAWRPDGKVLAIGYSGGELILINVENKSVLHTLQVSGEITCVNWVQEKKVEPVNIKQSMSTEEEGNNYTKYVDFSKHFLSKPLNLSTYETGNFVEEANNNLFHKQSLLNVLLIGTDDGMLYVSIFGALSCGAIDLNEKINAKCAVIDVQFSERLDVATVAVRDVEHNNVKLVVVDAAVFESHVRELFCLAMKKVELQTHVGYLYKSISSVMETWESILLEMDAKLSNYASKVEPGTLSTDFLDLLMFGICSDEMQVFLFTDMTKRGLEKFGQNIEMNYANIQKVLLKNIAKLGQNITYHLSELRGMSRLTSRYKALRLEEGTITEAISANGSFLIKSGEMQQIINNSMMYYKTFFRWLYSAIVNLLEEQVPAEMQNMTQQDLAYIAEFLQYFDRIGSQNNTTIGDVEKSGFIMERLGQYLADRDLTILASGDQHDWDNLLMHHECLRSHPSVLRHCKEMSLIQQIAHLQSAVDAIFRKPEAEVAKNMRTIHVVNVIQSELDAVAGISCASGCFMHAFPNSARTGVYFVEIRVADDKHDVCIRAALLHVRQDGDAGGAQDGAAKHSVTDVKFYSESVLSLLLEDRHEQAVLMQCPIASFREKLQAVANDDLTTQDVVGVDVTDASPLKNIQMTASKFAVSGCRSVSVVLADNRKKVMLFEIEGEEEEEEEEDNDMTTSSVRESDQDASMQENSDAE